MSLLQDIHNDYKFMLQHNNIAPATVEKYLLLNNDVLLSDILYNIDAFNSFAKFAGIPAAVLDPETIQF